MRFNLVFFVGGVICVLMSNAWCDCGNKRTFYSNTQKVSDKEFLYTSRTDYDKLSKMAFREAQKNSIDLSGLVYECDPSVNRSMYCDAEQLVLAHPGWVWQGQEITEPTLFYCSDVQGSDSWGKVKLVDKVSSYAIKRSVVNVAGASCQKAWGLTEAVCQNLPDMSHTTEQPVAKTKSESQSATSQEQNGQGDTSKTTEQPVAKTKPESQSATTAPTAEKKTPTTGPAQKTSTAPANGTECQTSVPHARPGQMRDGKCVLTGCVDGYEIKNDKCIEISGPCDVAPTNSTASHRKYNTKNKQIECSVDNCATGYIVSADKLSCHPDPSVNLAQAQQREQSFANRMTGGATMAATGIGGMMLASGLAEQSADADAESAMRAYLATFHCNYGGGKNVAGGTTDVELPGGNELIGLYAEYVNLANDLKSRKEQLGLRPGIESAAILESATSGLYDDVAVGKTSGAYVSLARALMNPDGEDAKMWAEQTDKTAQQIKTGAITAGAGGVVGVAGNVAINHQAMKQKK